MTQQSCQRDFRRLSVIVPLFNEAATVREMLCRLAAVDMGLELEIIVVDDGSSDGSVDIVRQFAKEQSELDDGPVRIQVLLHGENRGKGSSVRTGLQEITGEVVVVQDADLEYDPRELPGLLEPILANQADVVYGSRFLGSFNHGYYLGNYLGNQFLTKLSSLVTGLNVTDVETCYKAMRSDVAKSLGLRACRFEIEPEITARLAQGGFRFQEVPISYQARTFEQGKKISWWDGVVAIWAIFRYRFLP